MAFTSSVDVFIQFVLEIRKQLKLVGGKKKELLLLVSFGVWRQVRFLIALQYQPVALKQVENKTKKKKQSYWIRGPPTGGN